MHLGIWLPKDAIVVADNWQTLGLRGSGSTSYSIDAPAFVPSATPSTARRRTTRTPTRSTSRSSSATSPSAASCSASPATPCDWPARRCGPPGRRRTGDRRGRATVARRGDGRSRLRVRWHRATSPSHRRDHLRLGHVLTPLHEARMTAANAVAAAALRRVLPLCTELAGARYILDTNPLQRVIRDAYGALAHAGAGRVHLGAMAASAVEAHPPMGWTLADDPLDQAQRPASTAAATDTVSDDRPSQPLHPGTRRRPCHRRSRRRTPVRHRRG